MAQHKDEYLSSDEILKRYPCLMSRFNWNTTTPGQLHAIGILHGKYFRGRRLLLISLFSMKKLISYYKADLEDMKHELE